MNVTLESGKYVVAVSGGLDSMVLLHLLTGRPGLELTVAHFDHGIREEAAEDRRFVEQIAAGLSLAFIYAEGILGAEASEARARQARYAFLESARVSTGARAIVTAHHQDDVLETVIINLIRGTGRKGLASLSSTQTIRRPLLHLRRADLEDHARQHGVTWREDSTNRDTRYLRNHIRRHVVPRLGAAGQERLLNIVAEMTEMNCELDSLLLDWITKHTEPTGLNRREFILLPHAVAREAMAAWLRQHDVRDFDVKTIERLVQTAKISVAGKRANAGRGLWLKIGKDTLALEHSER